MTTKDGQMAEQPAREARRAGRETSRTATPLGWLARAGFVARGLVYGIIGVLALKLALGDGGKATDQQGALQRSRTSRSASTLLALVAIGLGRLRALALVRAAIGHGPEHSDSGVRPHRRARERHRLRDPLRDGGQDPHGSNTAARGTPKRRPAACSDWPDGTLLVGARRRRASSASGSTRAGRASPRSSWTTPRPSE